MFESHQGHWWCQEGHPSKISHVPQLQTVPKPAQKRSEYLDVSFVYIKLYEISGQITLGILKIMPLEDRRLKDTQNLKM